MTSPDLETRVASGGWGKPRRSRVSPMQRSLAMLRKRGMTCGVTEHFNVHVGIRQDLLGFVDIIAVGQPGIVAVQTTSIANISSRETKVLANPAAYLWALHGGVVVMHGWRKLTTGRWECEERRISVADFNEARRDGITPEYKRRRRKQRAAKAASEMLFHRNGATE